MNYNLHQFIPRGTHAALDYLLGILVAISPWIVGFAGNVMATQIAVVLGCVLVLCDLFTSYELGLVRMLPFAVNLFFDFLIGIALTFAFVIFDVNGRVGITFCILGLLILFNTFCAIRPKDTPTS
jgi:hypothetical protein